MAGRGRGRGRGQLSFSMEVVGIGKGENLPPSTLQPTPLFPAMEHKPVPLLMGEEAEYTLALKQEFRGAMKSLPFYIRPAAPKKDVERYSDKHLNPEPTDNGIEWEADWRRLPAETPEREYFMPVTSQRHNTAVAICFLFHSETSAAPRLGPPLRLDQEEMIRRLETLEKKEEEEDGEKKKQEEEEQEAEEEYAEEEFEEETDYIMSYFDNGEEFGGDSDDNMDEVIY